MPLPDCPRVIFEKNPLEFVIFQVRFPAILRIESELPAEFQERIRLQYPIHEEAPPTEQALPPEVAQLFASQMTLRLGRNFKFGTPDGQWQVSLSRDALALTCKRYERWEEFKSRLRGPLQALDDIYAPSFYSRIGLRYRDVIVRSAIGLEDVPWSELLKPHIAGALDSPGLDTSEVQHVENQVMIRLHAEGFVRVLHGLAVVADSKECAYVIDSDYFTNKKTETRDVIQTLEAFNLEARRLFRWCIQDRLYDAMDPCPA